MLITREVRTRIRNEWVDITPLIVSAVAESGIKEGMVLVYCPHTTAAITINENADPSVPRDLNRKLSALIPEYDNYEHGEGNSDAHLKASLFGAGQSLVVDKGKVVLGTWQSVYFCEFDGPRTRRVHIKVM
jgi:secondary thiamine-phosphate synthase enzyme